MPSDKFMHIKPCSDWTRKTPQSRFYTCIKRSQLETILSTAFHTANYASLNVPLVVHLSQISIK